MIPITTIRRVTERFSLLVIFMLLATFTQAQEKSGEIIYKVTTTPDYEKWRDSILDANNNEMAVKIVRAEMAKNRKAVEFLQLRLTFNSHFSHFESLGSMNNDNGIDLNEVAASTGVNGVYYTDLKNRIVLHQLLDKNWIIETSLDSLDWKITSEVKEIQGYRCQKATATINLNRIKKGKITAWFTSDLQYQFGPLELAGLPGLVLGLERNHYYFYADKINIRKKKQSIKKPSKGKVVSQKEYFENVEKWEKREGLN